MKTVNEAWEIAEYKLALAHLLDLVHKEGIDFEDVIEFVFDKSKLSSRKIERNRRYFKLHQEDLYTREKHYNAVRLKNGELHRIAVVEIPVTKRKRYVE